MEPKFVNCQESVLRISVATKFRIVCKAHELAIEIIDERGDQMGISTKLVTDDGTIPDLYSLNFWSFCNYVRLSNCKRTKLPWKFYLKVYQFDS